MLAYVSPEKMDYEQVENPISDDDLLEMIQRIIEPRVEDIDRRQCNIYSCDYASICPFRRRKPSNNE